MDAFLTRSNEVLAQIAQIFEDDWDGADVDIEEGMVLVTLPQGQQYVINRHGVMRQIWLSSPVSGAHHFALTQDRWVCTRTHVDLLDLLNQEQGLSRQ